MSEEYNLQNDESKCICMRIFNKFMYTFYKKARVSWHLCTCTIIVFLCFRQPLANVDISRQFLILFQHIFSHFNNSKNWVRNIINKMTSRNVHPRVYWKSLLFFRSLRPSRKYFLDCSFLSSIFPNSFSSSFSTYVHISIIPKIKPEIKLRILRVEMYMHAYIE